MRVATEGARSCYRPELCMVRGTHQHCARCGEPLLEYNTCDCGTRRDTYVLEAAYILAYVIVHPRSGEHIFGHRSKTREIPVQSIA